MPDRDPVFSSPAIESSLNKAPAATSAPVVAGATASSGSPVGKLEASEPNIESLEAFAPPPEPRKTVAPEWGLNLEGPGPKWGARAIFNSYGLKDKKDPRPIDLVYNRQSMVGGEHPACREALGKWLDQVGLPLMNKAIAAKPHEESFEIKSHLYVLQAQNQGGGGYIYLGAATRGDATPEEVAAAKWSGKDPIPEIGDRVGVQMNNFGPGTVIGRFVEGEWAGVKVLLDKLPDKKAAGGYDWADHMRRNKSIEVIHAFGVEVSTAPEHTIPAIDAKRNHGDLVVSFKDYEARVRPNVLGNGHVLDPIQGFAGKNPFGGYTYRTQAAAKQDFARVVQGLLAGKGDRDTQG